MYLMCCQPDGHLSIDTAIGAQQKEGSMKVVAIQGSPHRGNTYDRVEKLGEILTGLGDVEFEHLALKDVDLKPCQGCFLCFIRGEESCPLKDDRAMIEQKLTRADAVVFASPVYSMHVSYLLKRFVDRLAYTFHRPRYFDKFAVGLGVTAGIGLTEALEYIKMFAGAWGFEYAGELRYVDPPRNSNLPRFAEEKDHTHKVARRLYHLMKTKPPRKLTRTDHLCFHVMRAVYGRMEKYSPTDYAYWKNQGWLEPGIRYFTSHARAGPVKSLYARCIAWLTGRAMDRQAAKLKQSGEQVE